MAQKIKSTDGTEKELSEIVGEKGMWIRDGLKILSYNACKKLFVFSGLKHASQPQFVCVPDEGNKQQHIWLVALQNPEGVVFYAEGEASKYNTGELATIKDPTTGTPKVVYNETNKVDAKYRSRMAYKRAFCRCVMDALSLEEFYSEDDASNFKLEQVKGGDINVESL